LSGEITDQDISLSKDISEELKKRYLFCQKVELILLNLPMIQEKKLIWPGIIQTKSLKIAGSDRDLNLLNLPQFKPGFDLINYVYTWEHDLAKTLDILEQLPPHHLRFSAEVKKQCGWIARRMVRTGFELVMEVDQSYTPDLYYCYDRFSAYFPEKQGAMKKALELAIAPSGNRPGLILFLRDFGRWLVSAVNRKFNL
jgi:hypothetical protein